MRFPIKVNKQRRCPVCRKTGPGTKSPVTPRAEVVSLSFDVMSDVHARSYPVFLGSFVQLGWDSGISKHPQSRASVGASFFVLKKDAKTPEAGQIDIQFCSVRCLRRFLRAMVDELEQRIEESRRELPNGNREASRPIRKRRP